MLNSSVHQCKGVGRDMNSRVLGALCTHQLLGVKHMLRGFAGISEEIWSFSLIIKQPIA